MRAALIVTVIMTVYFYELEMMAQSPTIISRPL